MENTSSNSSLPVEVRESQELGYRPRLNVKLGKGKTLPLAIRRRRQWSQAASYDIPCTANSPCKRTDSSVSMKRAKGWIASCLKHHDDCRLAMPHAEDLFSPSRLVKVSVDHQPVRIIETMNEAGPFRYLALSHCWGIERIFTLIDANLDELKTAIPLDKLPRNFKDAIEITAALGFQYIWIDSLCIIQGNAVDWAKESARMGRVYANAVCTISATASNNAAGGCFFLRDPFISDCVLGTQLFSSIVAKSPTTSLKGLDSLFQEKVENAPVTKRGWIFQERALSKRVLHFSDGVLLFECNTLLATDYHPKGIPHQKPKQHFDLSGTALKWMDYSDHIFEYVVELFDYGISWVQIIVAYPAVILNHVASCALLGFATVDINDFDTTRRVEYMGSRPLSRPRPARTVHRTSARASTIESLDLPEIESPDWPYFPGIPEPEDDRILPGFVGMRRAFQAVTNHPREGWSVAESLEFHQQWMELVEPYSARKLTDHKDRLVALVGVATFVQEEVGIQFLAGLWKGALGWNLLWRCESPDKERKDRPLTRWSWASVDGRVTHDFTPDTTSARETDTIKQTVEDIKFLVNTDEWTINILNEVEGMIYHASLVVDACRLLPFEGSSVNFYPDLEEDYSDSSLFLLPIVKLSRNYSSEIHGIVVRRAGKHLDNTFERVGYFSHDNLTSLEDIAPSAVCLI